MRVCHQCQAEIPLEGPIGRRETCHGCGADLRCCRNCSFYDVRSADACREPNAELVQNKEAATFCDFFILTRPSLPGSRPAEGDARAQLDALFKKKP